jgi:hypothetical protein
MSVRLHIERVVLDGLALPPHEVPRLRAALHDELVSLLAAGGVARVARDESRDGERAVDMRGTTDGRTFGRHLAQAIYGRVSARGGR